MIVENIVAINIITSIYIWVKQTCQKLLTELFQCIDADKAFEDNADEDSDKVTVIVRANMHGKNVCKEEESHLFWKGTIFTT